MPILNREKQIHALLYGKTFTPEQLRNGSIELTPEEAIAMDLDPETGTPLAELNIADHIARQWPKARSDEAIRRIEMLQKWATDHATPPPAPEPAPTEPPAEPTPTVTPKP